MVGGGAATLGPPSPRRFECLIRLGSRNAQAVLIARGILRGRSAGRQGKRHGESPDDNGDNDRISQQSGRDIAIMPPERKGRSAPTALFT